MISSRDRNIVVVSQFNINGSRGQDAGKFVSDYVSRDSATDASQAYLPRPGRIPVEGDGVAFTLNDTAISRQETLDIADRVQELHETGKRAIQQMVISFDPEYLVEQNVIPEDTVIIGKGDYRHTYDDVRLRHAVRSGLQAMIDNEGYRDAKAVGCIQWDTRHLHVHAVVYEDAEKIGRKHKSEERGVIKESSLNKLTHDINRNLAVTKTSSKVPNEMNLKPKQSVTRERPVIEAAEPVYINEFLQVIERQQREAALLRKRRTTNTATELNNDALVDEAHDIAHKIITPEGDIIDKTDKSL